MNEISKYLKSVVKQKTPFILHSVKNVIIRECFNINKSSFNTEKDLLCLPVPKHFDRHNQSFNDFTLTGIETGFQTKVYREVKEGYWITKLNTVSELIWIQELLISGH